LLIEPNKSQPNGAPFYNALEWKPGTEGWRLRPEPRKIGKKCKTKPSGRDVSSWGYL
jgi:hypothetical protein